MVVGNSRSGTFVTGTHAAYRRTVQALPSRLITLADRAGTSQVPCCRRPLRRRRVPHPLALSCEGSFSRVRFLLCAGSRAPRGLPPHPAPSPSLVAQSAAACISLRALGHFLTRKRLRNSTSLTLCASEHPRGRKVLMFDSEQSCDILRAVKGVRFRTPVYLDGRTQHSRAIAWQIGAFNGAFDLLA